MKYTIIAGFCLVLSACASHEERPYHNMDNDCMGTVDREYSISMDTENGDVEQNKEVTCQPLEHDPFKGQREPSIKELKKDQTRK